MPATKDRETSSRQRALIGAGIAAAAAGAAGAAALVIQRKRKADGEDDVLISDAPDWTLRDRREGAHGKLIGRSATINRPREEVYRRWRDFAEFPKFMENVRRVEMIDDRRSRWTIEAPAGTSVELVTEITADEPGRRIAWASTGESQIATSGEVLFEEAATGRGTIVRLVQSYSPPAGIVGKAVAKLFGREPYVQARRDLRRFKQLLETGEVTTNASPSGRPSETPYEARI